MIEGDFVRAERIRAQKQAKLLSLQDQRDKEASGRFIELYVQLLMLVMMNSIFTETSRPVPNLDLMHIFLEILVWVYLFQNLMESTRHSNRKNLVLSFAIIENLLLSQLKYKRDLKQFIISFSRVPTGHSPS
jgi:hypothetical protein